MLETAKEVLRQGYVCDHCLGRQFAQLGSGMSNQERGKGIRAALMMLWDSDPFDVDTANFYGLEPRKQKTKFKQHGSCMVCRDLFKRLNVFIPKVRKALEGIEFNTFVVGTKVSPELVSREESLWEAVGIEWCEQIRAEINRETGKLLETALAKEVDIQNPDVEIILNLNTGKIEPRISSLFVYGGYKKLVRGIPQTKWDTYKTSVEDIIARPFMSATKGGWHSLHGSGREDIDARCLDWRPFVLEIKGPKKRKIDLKTLQKKVNKSKKVRVYGLRLSSKREVRSIKAEKRDKTYRLVASFEEAPERLSRLRKLKGPIKQQTPTRVAHRRADLVRKRHVRSISWKKKSSKVLEFTIKAESGLYVKELVTGDDGRTNPSAAKLLDNPAKIKSLDVVRIWKAST